MLKLTPALDNRNCEFTLAKVNGYKGRNSCRKFADSLPQANLLKYIQESECFNMSQIDANTWRRTLHKGSMLTAIGGQNSYFILLLDSVKWLTGGSHCEKRSNGLQRCPHSRSHNLWLCIWHGKMNFANIRILRYKNFSELSEVKTGFV